MEADDREGPMLGCPGAPNVDALPITGETSEADRTLAIEPSRIAWRIADRSRLAASTVFSSR